MFMPETEDMLPRAAPRPCDPMPLGHTAGEIVKPTVPEISILFGQQEAQVQQQQQQQHQQQPHQQQQQRPVNNFASWKKQMLPRVNFSPVLETELGPRTPPASSSVGISTGNEYNYYPRSRAFDSDRTTPTQPLTCNGNIGYAHYPPETYATDHPSPRMPNPSSAGSDVLTICASTQTDSDAILSRKNSISDLGNLADKKDMRDVLSMLEVMRQEQQQLRRLCESFLHQQQQLPASNKSYKETGSQCALVVPNQIKRIMPIVHDYIVEEDEVPAVYEVPARVAPQFQSPRPAPPMAQSTGYRANTPQGKQLPPAAAANVPQVLPKSSTDKSMVMSELALKYLPQRQINELMEDLHVSPKPANDIVTNTTPLRQIDNFTQSPSNMSNASYKYLKKYRLLSEEQLGYDDHHNMLSPQGIQRTPRSPLVASPVGQEPMLNLDNIRNQPKLI